MWRGFGLVRLWGPALVALCRLVAPEEIVMTIPAGTRRAEGVYQLEKGGSLWRIQVTRRDPQTRRRVCRRSVIEAKSLSLAKVRRAELALRLEEELAGASVPAPVADPTVADFGERWLEERAARRQPIFNLTLPNMAPPERDASQVRALSSFVFAENTRPEQGRRAFFPRRTVPTPALFPFPAGFALSSSLEGEGISMEDLNRAIARGIDGAKAILRY